MQTVRADLDNAAHVCAGEVRAGCADAPEEPNWLESGLKFVGGILEGAGEAVWDLLTMVPFSPVNMVIDSYKLATGDLTPEELMKKYELSAENAWDMAQGIYTGLTTDPIGFGKELGKSLLDWDTWADDPARAIGHLVPDAIVAVATGGSGALATRGGKFAMDALDSLSDLGRFRHLDDLERLRRPAPPRRRRASLDVRVRPSRHRRDLARPAGRAQLLARQPQHRRPRLRDLRPRPEHRRSAHPRRVREPLHQARRRLGLAAQRGPAARQRGVRLARPTCRGWTASAATPAPTSPTTTSR